MKECIEISVKSKWTVVVDDEIDYLKEIVVSSL